MPPAARGGSSTPFPVVGPVVRHRDDDGHGRLQALVGRGLHAAANLAPTRSPHRRSRPPPAGDFIPVWRADPSPAPIAPPATDNASHDAAPLIKLMARQHPRPPDRRPGVPLPTGADRPPVTTPCHAAGPISVPHFTSPRQAVSNRRQQIHRTSRAAQQPSYHRPASIPRPRHRRRSQTPPPSRQFLRLRTPHPRHRRPQETHRELPRAALTHLVTDLASGWIPHISPPTLLGAAPDAATPPSPTYWAPPRHATPAVATTPTRTHRRPRGTHRTPQSTNSGPTLDGTPRDTLPIVPTYGVNETDLPTPQNHRDPTKAVLTTYPSHDIATVVDWI